MKVSWKDSRVTSKLTYSDLDVGDSFVIDTPSSKGAVYTKCVYRVHSFENLDGKNQYYQMEIATGKLFSPTNSAVKRVNVEVEIDVNKPSCY